MTAISRPRTLAATRELWQHAVDSFTIERVDEVTNQGEGCDLCGDDTITVNVHGDTPPRYHRDWHEHHWYAETCVPCINELLHRQYPAHRDMTVRVEAAQDLA